MDKEIKSSYAKYKGKIKLQNNEIDCYVTNTGERLISLRATLKSIANIDGGKLGDYIGINPLKPYINKDLVLGELVDLDIPNTQYKAKCLDTETFLNICRAYVSALSDGVLSTERQKEIAIKCSILLSACADIGLIALIDEATGYQHDRERDALQKILKAYISEELLPWQKKFPDIYYKELFRLNGWNYTIEDIKKRPSCIGGWTNTIIYEQLPNGVLKELKERTPKNEKGNRTHRYHQLLTEDIGNPHLNNQIQQVLAWFKISNNMQEFWHYFKTALERDRGQLKLPFEFDAKGYSISPNENVQSSKFKKNIEQALNFNPNKD